MAAGILNGRVSIDVRKLPQAESVIIMHGWVGKPINKNLGSVVVIILGVEHFAHPRVQLIVSNAAPILRLHVLDGTTNGIVDMKGAQIIINTVRSIHGGIVDQGGLLLLMLNIVHRYGVQGRRW